MDEEIELAHIIGSNKLTDGMDDLVFSHNKKMYRTFLKNGKLVTKLICNVSTELISIENRIINDENVGVYLFRIESEGFEGNKESYFKPQNLFSSRTFTSKLMSTFSFGRFFGNDDDFTQFFMDEIDRYNLMAPQ